VKTVPLIVEHVVYGTPVLLKADLHLHLNTRLHDCMGPLAFFVMLWFNMIGKAVVHVMLTCWVWTSSLNLSKPLPIVTCAAVWASTCTDNCT
jgi:hypothetical protein